MIHVCRSDAHFCVRNTPGRDSPSDPHAYSHSGLLTNYGGACWHTGDNPHLFQLYKDQLISEDWQDTAFGQYHSLVLLRSSLDVLVAQSNILPSASHCWGRFHGCCYFSPCDVWREVVPRGSCTCWNLWLNASLSMMPWEDLAPLWQNSTGFNKILSMPNLKVGSKII